MRSFFTYLGKSVLAALCRNESRSSSVEDCLNVGWPRGDRHGTCRLVGSSHTGEPSTSVSALLVLSVLLITAAPQWQDTARSDEFLTTDEGRPIIVDAEKGQLRILAELQPEAFSGGWLKSTPNYHAVVWKGGRAAAEALLAAYGSDADFYDAMLKIGAVPGNNLTMAAWNDRKDPNSKAPDEQVQGTRIEVLVLWEGLQSPIPLKDLLLDPAGKGIDMRFGGNKALIPQWHSGCIACLYSCPGGKVSNHSYTIRDYVKGTTMFSVNWSIVPKGKRKAVVIFRKR